jgi:nitroreductase
MKAAIVDAKVGEVVANVIRKRRSTRHFLDTPIPKSVLLQLVEAGIWAPSGSNWQNQRFLIIDDKQEVERLGHLRFVWPYRNADQSKIRKDHPGGIIGHAAAVIAVFADSLENDRRGMGEYHLWEALEIQNCAASIENILLLATSFGIASCWVSASEGMNCTRLLSGRSWRHAFADYAIPPYYKIQGLVLLGYPRTVDDEGFPPGESMHGATIWQGVERKPIESYLVARSSETGKPMARSLPAIPMMRLKIASRAIVILLALVRKLDRMIHRIEIDQILSQKTQK